MKARRTRWIIELDYDADPDLPSEFVRNRVQDQLTKTRGTPIQDGNRIIFDHSDDAMWLKLQFSENVKTIESV